MDPAHTFCNHGAVGIDCQTCNIEALESFKLYDQQTQTPQLSPEEETNTDPRTNGDESSESDEDPFVPNASDEPQRPVMKEFNRTFSSGKGKVAVHPPRNDKKKMKTIAKPPRTTGPRNLANQKPKSGSNKKPIVKPKKQVAGKRNRYSLDFYYKRTCYRA